jgi:hypothetical protein
MGDDGEREESEDDEWGRSRLVVKWKLDCDVAADRDGADYRGRVAGVRQRS